MDAPNYSLLAYMEADKLTGRQKVLAALSDGHPKTREQLAAYTRLPYGSVNARVRELVTEGVAHIQGEGTTKAQRRCGKITIKR